MHGRGAAVLRQQRRMDVDHAQARDVPAPPRVRILPYAATTPMSAPSAARSSSAAGSLSVAGCRIGSAGLTRACLHRRVATPSGPRPRGRSGCVTTPTTACAEARSASSVGTANCGVPKKTTFSPSALTICRPSQLPDLADDQIALDAAQPIDEQRAVEVIHLVLERARQQSVPSICCGWPSRSSPFDDGAQRPDDRGVEAGTLRQPSSSSCMPSRSTNSGIDHHDQPARIAPERDVDDEDAQRHADLRRRQADARRGVHRLDHVVDQALDLGVISSTGAAGSMQHVGRRSAGMVGS